MKLFRISLLLPLLVFCVLSFGKEAHAIYPLGTEGVFYDCEGTTGTTTNSGTGGSTYDGTFGGNGSTSPLVAKFGSRSCSFGETGDYLKTYFGSSTNPTTSSISVSMWVYKKEASGGCTAEADHFFGSSGQPSGSRFYARCNTGNHWGMRFGAAAAADATTTISHQTWEHIVIVFDAANDTPKMYVNNVLRATSGLVSSFTIRGDFYLGMANDTITTPGVLNTSEGANAYIDDIAFYSTVLSASDIATLYNAGTTPGQPTGLTATPYENKVFLSWTSPGGTFTDYKVEYKLSSEPTTWTTFNDGVSSSTASTTVTGLTNGLSYDFRISTLNNALVGTPSSTVVSTPYYRITFVSPTISTNSTTTSSTVTAYASSTGTTASSTHYISITNPEGSVVSQVSTSTRYGDYNVRHLDAVLSNSDLALLDNSSGIAYVPNSGTLFLVHNRATGADSTIDELDTSGTLIRSITCTACGDVEGITLISTAASSTVGGYDYTFMISTENDTANAEIYRIIIHSTGTTAVNKTDYFDTGITHAANGGLEGIAYNPTSGVFYVARELTTPALYEVTLGANHSTVTNQICTNLTWDASVSDFSDLAYNNGILYVLSENTNTSKLVPVDVTSTSTCAFVDSDEDGDVSGTDSGNWLTSLAVGVTDQAEGVTWDGTGDYLYVLGEADFLAKYRTNRYTVRNTFSSVSDGSYLLKSSYLDSNGVTANASTITFGVDVNGPTISSIASTTEATTAVVSWTTNENADSKVSYGTVSGTYTTSTTSSSETTSHSLGLTSLSASTNYYYVVVSTDEIGNTSTSSEKTLLTTAVPDSDAPTISSISAGTLTDTSAIITWTTNEEASSLVLLGITTSLGSTTAETDTGTRVTSHSVSLSNLKACTRYYYKVQSKDSTLNTTLSSVTSFTTTGCTGSASVEDITAVAVTEASGGTINLVSDGKGPTLTIPAAFSGADADFQIKKLEDTDTIAGTGSPTGLTLASDLIYDFKAYSDVSTLVTSFSQPITVTIAYTNSDISSLTESSLTIKRWDGSVWNDLSSCTLDASANTVSCTTTQFSVFGLFGTVSSTPTPTTTRNRSGFLIRPKPIPTTTIPSVAMQHLTLPLSFGSWSAQVKTVQQILNMDISTQVSSYGAGSAGKETIWYGPATRAAVQKFQLKYGIVKSDKDPGYGRVGPATRKKMNDLLNS